MHHDLGCLGSEINQSAIDRQILKLKEAGFNAIRLTHNPSCAEFTNACMRIGIMCIEEAFDCWTISKKPYDYARFFLEYAESDVKSMVKRSLNNPCVIAWSLGNDHDNHSLHRVAEGDYRDLIAGPQAFAKTAPLSLLMVADFEKYGSDSDHARMMVYCDAGIVSQNISLYCAAVGLCTVPRGIMNVEGLSNLLGLGEKQIPVLNNPVGYPKE